MMARLSSLVAALLLVLQPAPMSAAEGFGTPPPDQRLSIDRLARIDSYFAREIAAGKIPGAIVFIQRYGKPVYVRMFGKRDVETGEPMTPDTIFRLHSMTKPLTSVLAMSLVDDGRLKLNDPVSKYIPSFEKMFVGVESKTSDGNLTLTLEPARRLITIEDLLRHSAGITYGFYGKGLVRRTYADADLFSDDIDNKQLAEKVALLPLAEQPGMLWDYGHSTDVLGRVIEVVSGQSLYDFGRDRLFGPLGMRDTNFYVSDPAKHHLIAEPMPSDKDFKAGGERDPRRPTKWESGGGGMLSTVQDIARFCQMILNGGTFQGRRYLKPPTFAAMTKNQIEPNGPLKKADYYFPGDGFGFGLGFGVRTDAGEQNLPGAIGELKWDGASGTYFSIDRAQQMFTILMIQSPSERGRIQRDLRAMVYDAFEN